MESVDLTLRRYEVDDRVTYTLEIDGKFFIIENVPGYARRRASSFFLPKQSRGSVRSSRARKNPCAPSRRRFSNMRDVHKRHLIGISNWSWSSLPKALRSPRISLLDEAEGFPKVLHSPRIYTKAKEEGFGGWDLQTVPPCRLACTQAGTWSFSTAYIAVVGNRFAVQGSRHTPPTNCLDC